MKTWMTLGLALSLAVELQAGALLTDIATYEVAVMDDAGGLVASGGPWMWQNSVAEMLAGDLAGAGRAIGVKCRDAAGEVIFDGELSPVDLYPPWTPVPLFPDPFLDPPPLLVSLVFIPDNNVVRVLLNGMTELGTVALEPIASVKTISVDIKPGSATNPFNTGSKGVLPVAVLGSVDVDIRQIDAASLELAGLSPVRQVVADVQSDGIPDLMLFFRDQDVAGTLTGVADREVVSLKLTGVLTDGTVLEGADSLTVLKKK